MIPGSFTHINRVRYTLGVNINKGTIINLHCVQRKIEEFYIYKEGFFYFSIYTVSRIFFDAVSKLIERVSSLRTSYRVVSLYLRRCTFMNCSNCQTRNSPCLLSIFISFRAYVPRPFWNLHRGSCCGYLYTAVPVYFLCNSFRGLSVLSRNMETSRSLRSLIFTVYVRFRILTKRSLCLRLFVNLK